MVTNLILKFLEEYRGRKLSIAISGGGYSLLRIMEYPGISDFIDGIISPYSDEYMKTSITLINNIFTNQKATSLERLSQMIQMARSLSISSDNIKPIAVTASLITTREQRGENRAYIYVDGNYYLISFSKYSDYDHLSKSEIIQRRKFQDEVIACFILHKLIGIKEEFKPDWRANVRSIEEV